jgi:hypothetical protein
VTARVVSRLAFPALLALTAVAAPATAAPSVKGELEVPARDSNNKLAAGPDGNIWVTLGGGGDDLTPVAPGEPPPGTPTPQPIVPTTQIDKGPEGDVKTAARRARVKFRFSSPDAGAGFECRLDLVVRRKAVASKAVSFASCASPQVYRLEAGRYRFEVRAKLGPSFDPSPPARSFRVVRVAKPTR